jgi:hypothetical protein
VSSLCSGWCILCVLYVGWLLAIVVYYT